MNNWTEEGMLVLLWVGVIFNCIMLSFVSNELGKLSNEINKLKAKK